MKNGIVCSQCSSPHWTFSGCGTKKYVFDDGKIVSVKANETVREVMNKIFDNKIPVQYDQEMTAKGE